MHEFDGAVQIAGVIDRAEAELLVGCGVEWLGFPLRLAFHREDLSDADATAVDAHTGVEGPDGRKRRDLVETFVAEAKRAFAGRAS
jgi:hypothetical protein